MCLNTYKRAYLFNEKRKQNGKINEHHKHRVQTAWEEKKNVPLSTGTYIYIYVQDHRNIDFLLAAAKVSATTKCSWYMEKCT